MKKLLALVAIAGLSLYTIGCGPAETSLPAPPPTPSESTPPADTPAETTPPADTPAEGAAPANP